MQTITVSTIDRTNDHYEELLDHVQGRFREAVDKSTPLFTTNADGLFDAFLAFLPPEARQHYTCHACRHFFERFGGLVEITDDGQTRSALWRGEDAPEFFGQSIRAVQNAVGKATVNGVFVSSLKVLGTPVTGDWHHLAVEPPPAMVFKGLTLNANQRAAEKREEFKMIIAGLLEYPLAAVEQAVTLLKSEALYRSEKCLGAAEWLRDLHIKRNATRNTRLKSNLVWRAVATAPIGYAHIKSTMIGTLLDDIVSGMSFAAVSKRFADKMHPLQYQRPQAPPSAGNIAQAEKIIAELGAAGSLARRFARLEELRLIWTPAVKDAPTQPGGVFGHLKAKGEEVKEYGADVPAKAMTWEKFYNTILPGAEAIEFLVNGGRDNYSPILTAVNFDAPPIIQWDMPDKRNPFSWYVYNGGSSPARFNLSPGFAKVTGVCFQPSMWDGEFIHHGKSVYFILDGCRDVAYKNSGNALFPEILKSELHGNRSTIEAYSHNATIEGGEEATACGIRLQAGSNWSAVFRVRSSMGWMNYKLDRWD